VGWGGGEGETGNLNTKASGSECPIAVAGGWNTRSEEICRSPGITQMTLEVDPSPDLQAGQGPAEPAPPPRQETGLLGATTPCDLWVPVMSQPIFRSWEQDRPGPGGLGAHA
jgi:hypothetical protein